MGKLTTHVLDTAHGCPAAGVRLALFRIEGESRILLRTTHTNADGRCDVPILQNADFVAGVYELQFEAGAYFSARGLDVPEPRFVDVVNLRFGIADASAHYHVPLLVSPFSYSTYRGS